MMKTSILLLLAVCATTSLVAGGDARRDQHEKKRRHQQEDKRSEGFPLRHKQLLERETQQPSKKDRNTLLAEAALVIADKENSTIN
jgi:hypothetical protein